MGVDGIGRSGGKPPLGGIGPAGTPSSVQGPGSAEGVAGAVGVASPATAAVSGTTPLAQLQRGEITLDQYLDARVADAVSPYIGKVPAEKLEFIKDSLRDTLASDPVVQELVRRTTGTVPSANE